MNISDELRLPLDAVTATQVIYGGKGMGKTNLASVLAEELHRARLEYEGVARMRPRKTFDSSATPKAGRSLRAPGKATKPDLAKYQARMAETIERAQMDDPAVLRGLVKQLEQELSQARRAVPDTPKVAPKSNEVPVLQKGELNRDALAWCESIGFHEPEQAAVAFLAGYTVGGSAVSLRYSAGASRIGTGVIWQNA